MSDQRIDPAEDEAVYTEELVSPVCPGCGRDTSVPAVPREEYDRLREALQRIAESEGGHHVGPHDDGSYSYVVDGHERAVAIARGALGPADRRTHRLRPPSGVPMSDQLREERDRLREAGNAMADRFDALLAELSWSDEESEAERTAINGWRAVSP
jgi:rRNA maturation protein Nop10